MSKIQLTIQEKNKLRDIAAHYGCKVVFNPKLIGGYWDTKKTIVIGSKSTLKETLSLFFHELAHFINLQTGKFPLYHDRDKYRELLKQIPSYGTRVQYRLRAEIYTEKVGKRLMKDWFPDIEYDAYYKQTKSCYNVLYGYFLTNER